jgi:peroxin-7
MDFNKYEQQCATSSVDKTIKIWDLRNLTVPVNILQDHRYPVKKVRFSPHLGWLLGSGSYDMNVHFYDLRNPVEPLRIKHAQHSEFVSAIDFNLYDERLVGSSSWDGRILIWEWDQPQPIIT